MSLAPLRFATTAARLAYTFVANDRGREVQDLENGFFYKVVAEGAGASKMVNLTINNVFVHSFSLRDFRIVSTGGDVGAIAAIGGVLGSNTDPIGRADAAESEEIFWAASSVIPVSVQASITSDVIDDTRDVTLELDIYSGTTNAADMIVESSWNGGTLVADAAVDTSTKSATRHTLSVTIAAADVPASVRHVTIALTPPTHGTDGIGLCGMRLKAFRK